MGSSSLKAQSYWNGTLNTTSNIYRSGQVGIGFGTAPTLCSSPLEVNGDINMQPSASFLRINCTSVLHAAGTNNIFVGGNAGIANTGTQNSFFGYSSGINNTSGSSNSFVGDRSGVSNSTGEKNLFAGSEAGFSNTSGSRNVYLGDQSGHSLNTWSDNVFVGAGAAYDLIDSEQNVGIGSRVLNNHNSAIEKAVVIGYEAGYNFGTALNGGTESVQIGYRAGYEDGGGKRSVSIGYEAGYFMQPTANENVLVGFQSGRNLTGGSGNTLLGMLSGSSLVTGHGNTLIGFAAQSGANNTNNTALGFQAQISSGFDNSTAIGMNSIACASNTIVLGSGTGGSNEVVVIGDCQANFGSIGDLEVVGGDLWAQGPWTSSDKRLKKDISRITNALSVINELSGYNYLYLDTNEIDVKLPFGEHVGLLAQELEEVFPYAVKQGSNGYLGVNYSAIIPLLLEGIKELQSEVILLKNAEEKPFFEKGASTIEKTARLHQNTPNPFSGETRIGYEIFFEYKTAELQIYDMTGERRLSFHEDLNSKSEFVVSTNSLSPGIYAYTLIVDGISYDTKTMVVSK